MIRIRRFARRSRYDIGIACGHDDRRFLLHRAEGLPGFRGSGSPSLFGKPGIDEGGIQTLEPFLGIEAFEDVLGIEAF